MAIKNCYYILLALIVHWTISVPQLPPYLKICKKSDPNLKECVKEAIEQIRPYLKTGIPNLIPSCEPLHIPKVVIDQGSGAVAVKSSYDDIKIYGPSKFIIKQLKIDLDKDRVKMKIFLPRLEIVSNYTMEGSILMLPLNGTGKNKGVYSDIDATIIMQGEKIKKDGETYVNIKDFLVDFNIGHAQIQLDNLFNGDKQLGEAMNSFLNENWKTVATEIKPVLEDTIAKMCKELANKIYHTYPQSVLLPD